MRGADGMQEALFRFTRLEEFVPEDHPLRGVRRLVNESLQRLNGLFNTIYADTGRASIAPRDKAAELAAKTAEVHHGAHGQQEGKASDHQE